MRKQLNAETLKGHILIVPYIKGFSIDLLSHLVVYLPFPCNLYKLIHHHCLHDLIPDGRHHPQPRESAHKLRHHLLKKTRPAFLKKKLSEKC